MRYLVKARVKPNQAVPLRRAIDQGTLGAGLVAEGEYLRITSNGNDSAPEVAE